VLASVLVHVLGGLGAASVPRLWEAEPVEDIEESEPDEPMSVSLSEPPPERPPRQKREATNRPRDQSKQPEPQDREKQETKPKPVEERNRKTVDQKTNEQVPDQADYLSNEANKTDEQTQARETTAAREASRSKQSPESAKDSTASGGQNPAALASRQSPSGRQGEESPDRAPSEPPPAPESPTTSQDQKSSPEAERSPESPVDEPTDEKKSAEIRASDQSEEQSSKSAEKTEQPDAPPMPTMRDYEQLFGGESDRQRQQPDEQTPGQGGPGHAMFKDIEQRRGQVKGALENYLTHIKPGNHTSVNARRSVYASYINRIHRKVHARWGSGYLPRLDSRYGPGHKLSDSSLHSVLEIVVDADSGEVADVNIVQSSGVTSYDAEAVMISYDTGPHPNPPEEIVSPDGRVYLHWNFWRDQRQCGTFGVSVYKRLEDGGGKQEISPTGSSSG
jgi:hypothetical protein